MHKSGSAIVLTLAACISGCDSQDWQPYIDKPEVAPTVTFPTLLECQQYLHFRFGNINSTGTMYCILGCSKSQAQLGPNEFRLGDLNCPVDGKQIVGQIIPRQ
jgi:hypothetical protein